MDRGRFNQEPFPAVWSRSVCPARSDHDCFVDEIAIDFPSVGPLIERQRCVFLGGPIEPDMLKTEVWLSVRDARRGAVLPLEVPLRGTCAACDGRGEQWLECCRSCRGTGAAPVSRRVLLSVPAGVPDGTRLRFRVKAPLTPSVRVEVRVAVRRTAA